jgi:hypothetical protein
MDLKVDTNISEEHTACIFRVLQPRRPSLAADVELMLSKIFQK